MRLLLEEQLRAGRRTSRDEPNRSNAPVARGPRKRYPRAVTVPDCCDAPFIDVGPLLEPRHRRPQVVDGIEDARAFGPSTALSGASLVKADDEEADVDECAGD